MCWYFWGRKCVYHKYIETPYFTKGVICYVFWYLYKTMMYVFIRKNKYFVIKNACGKKHRFILGKLLSTVW